MKIFPRRYLLVYLNLISVSASLLLFYIVFCFLLQKSAHITLMVKCLYAWTAIFFPIIIFSFIREFISLTILKERNKLGASSLLFLLLSTWFLLVAFIIISNSSDAVQEKDMMAFKFASFAIIGLALALATSPMFDRDSYYWKTDDVISMIVLLGGIISILSFCSQTTGNIFYNAR